MWENFVINAVLSVLKGVIKNPGKAAGLKDRLLEIRNAINALYPGE